MPIQAAPGKFNGVAKQPGQFREAAKILADSVRFDDGARDADDFPERELEYIRKHGLLEASLPAVEGGSALGSAAGTHAALLGMLLDIGRASLPLGRLLEGHTNALLLINAYGSPEQMRKAATEARAGKLFAVWNTDSSDRVRLARNGDKWEFTGAKAFASGAGHVSRPLVTTDTPDGRLMTIVPMDRADVRVDLSSWEPLGMVGSQSYTVDFTGVEIGEDLLIGAPGDYYRAPLFGGGAVRTSAAIMGGIEALYRYTRDFVKRWVPTERPFARARIARMFSLVEAGRRWIDFAAEESEKGLWPNVDGSAAERMNFAANATRIAIEDIGPQMARLATDCVGARGLLQPFRFASLIRDLTMFLRQPNPDEVLLDAGRFLLESEDENV